MDYRETQRGLRETHMTPQGRIHLTAWNSLDFNSVFAYAVGVGLVFSFSFPPSQIAGNAFPKHKIQNTATVITFQGKSLRPSPWGFWKPIVLGSLVTLLSFRESEQSDNGTSEGLTRTAHTCRAWRDLFRGPSWQVVLCVTSRRLYYVFFGSYKKLSNAANKCQNAVSSAVLFSSNHIHGGTFVNTNWKKHCKK